MASCNSILMFWKHFAFIYVFSLSKVGNEGEVGQSKPPAKLANTVEGALVDVELSRIQSLYAKLTRRVSGQPFFPCNKYGFILSWVPIGMILPTK